MCLTDRYIDALISVIESEPRSLEVWRIPTMTVRIIDSQFKSYCALAAADLGVTQ